MSNLPSSTASASPALDDHDALPAGTRFGELEILRVVGVGGFGIVYLARDHSLDRDVALKEYMPGQLAARGPSAQVSVRSGSHMETFALGLRSFVNEARLLARFDHRSLVKVYRFWEANNTAYMVMPFLQGRTLREARRAMTNPPDEAWIRQTINPLLEALELLHREAVYHRDIAPDNILLPTDGSQAVLLDFGAARRAIGDRTQTFTAILKPSYAPIEQYAESVSLRQGPWTDIYALGAVIHYLLKGVPPPPATARTFEDHSEVLADLSIQGVSRTFLMAVDWALSVRPQDRPQAVAEFRDALDGKVPAPVVARKSNKVTPSTDAFVNTAADPTRPAAHELNASPLIVDEPTMLLRPAKPNISAQSPDDDLVALAKKSVDPTARFKESQPASAHPARGAVMGSGRAAASASPRPLVALPATSVAASDAPQSPAARSAWPWVLFAALILSALAAWWLGAKQTKPSAVPDVAVTTVQSQTPPTVSTEIVAVPVQALPDLQKSPKVDNPVPVVLSSPASATAPPTPVPPVLPPVPAQTVTSAAPSDAPKVPTPKPSDRPEVTAKTAGSATYPPANSSGTTAATPTNAAPRIVLESRPPRNAGNANDAPRASAADTNSGGANSQRSQASPMWPPPPATTTDEQRQRGSVTAPRQAEKAPDSPAEVCAPRSFLIRPTCMKRECRSARFSEHPQCVQVRAQEEAEEQRRVFGGTR